MRKSGFSSLCRPEPHFKDAESPQRACTIIGFSISLQKWTFALNRVEHQKSVNIAKKFEISIVDFQKLSKTFLITTYKEKSRRRTIIRSKIMLHWWSSSIEIRKSDIWKVQANSKNTLEHTSNYSSKRLNVQRGESKMTTSCWFQSMQIWRRRNEAQLNRKCPDSLPSWSIHFWSKIANFSIKMHCEKNTM